MKLWWLCLLLGWFGFSMYLASGRGSTDGVEEGHASGWRPLIAATPARGGDASAAPVRNPHPREVYRFHLALSGAPAARGPVMARARYTRDDCLYRAGWLEDSARMPSVDLTVPVEALGRNRYQGRVELDAIDDRQASGAASCRWRFEALHLVVPETPDPLSPRYTAILPLRSVLTGNRETSALVSEAESSAFVVSGEPEGASSSNEREARAATPPLVATLWATRIEQSDVGSSATRHASRQPGD